MSKVLGNGIAFNPIVLLLLILFSFPLYAQKIVKGKVINKITRLGVPYTTIGLIKENKGTSANSEGEFKISASLYSEDSLRFSSVGYKTLIISLNNMSENAVVELEDESTILNEVFITKDYKNVVLNQFNGCSLNYFSPALISFSQLACYFKTPEENMKVKEINLCKLASNSLFRIRFYLYDSTSKGPGKDISDKVIEINSSKRKVEENLEKYNIIIPGREFFVAIEWIFTDFNAFKMKAKINKKQIKYIAYNPNISFKDLKENVNDAEAHEFVWVLNFNGKWEYLNPQFRSNNFLISLKMQ